MKRTWRLIIRCWKTPLTALALPLLAGCPIDIESYFAEPLVDEIVFESNRDGVPGSGYQDLYRVRLDGQGLQRLTFTPEDEADPSISPDGKFLAYTRGGAGADIFIMPARGGKARKITTYTGTDYRPAWSPDGKRLVFTSQRLGRYELFIIDRDGSNRRRLTFRPDTTDWVSAGAFSPDGQRLVFESWRDNEGIADLLTIGVDGENIETLPVDVPLARSASWSPDGRYIAFIGAQSRLHPHYLYLLDLQSGELKQILELYREASVPAWSPDGKTLAVENQVEGENGIYLVGLDGDNPRRLTAGDAGSPSWSPHR